MLGLTCLGRRQPGLLVVVHAESLFEALEPCFELIALLDQRSGL
jgi:hypothetical protein